MKYFLVAISILGAAGIGFLFLEKEKIITIEAPPFSAITALGRKVIDLNADIESQAPLINPPAAVKGIYLTGWTAGNSSRVDSLIQLIKSTELNSVVIDIKDYSGYVDYDIKVPEVLKHNAKEVRIQKINSLIKQLHDQGIYVIARITVFQDPVLAKARPELAIQSKSKGTIWRDHKGLAWIDPAAKDAWDYNIMIAKDAVSRGFDELNFDYIRFASDGNLTDMKFPVWDGKTQKREVIRNFFKYLREELKDVKISADLFGLATVQSDDLGIGQIIEDAYAYFDYVCPMVYPSHYSSGFLNYKNPADYPYEVIKHSMSEALKRLNKYNSEAEATTTLATAGTGTLRTPTPPSGRSNAKLRPWIQAFDLGAVYNKEMIGKELQAVADSGLHDGWLLWNPANVYARTRLPL